jgi:SAM-dependent methyltransferase
MKMDLMRKYYPESEFGGFTDVDATIIFHTRVQALIEPHMVLLDVGCGNGAHCHHETIAYRKNLQIYKGKVKQVIGIDVVEESREHPFLDEFRLITGNWPVENESVDLCICQAVIEHISDPEHFFSELHRVLKKGGYLCINTPNLFNYVSFISHMIPSRYHANILKKVQPGRKQDEVFPTYYKCNTIRKLRKILTRHDFEGVIYGFEPEPGYLKFSGLAYFLGVLHQRYAPKFMKPVIFVFAKKV